MFSEVRESHSSVNLGKILKKNISALNSSKIYFFFSFSTQQKKKLTDSQTFDNFTEKNNTNLESPFSPTIDWNAMKEIESMMPGYSSEGLNFCDNRFDPLEIKVDQLSQQVSKLVTEMAKLHEILSYTTDENNNEVIVNNTPSNTPIDTGQNKCSLCKLRGHNKQKCKKYCYACTVISLAENDMLTEAHEPNVNCPSYKKKR